MREDHKMNHSREELKAQYKCLILNTGTEKELFRTKCSQYLSENKLSDCFKLLPIIDVQKDFLEKTMGRKGVEMRHLANVFGLFENYAVNILDKPWYKDLKTIKVYTGFFKYNFEQWLSLDAVYQIFQLIGYKKTPAHTLTLDTSDNERLLVVAFELYLAYNQLCTFKSNVDLCSKYSMEDIFEGWFNTTGDVNHIQQWLIESIAKKEEYTHSMYDTLDESVRPVTTGVETRYYDKNGGLVPNPIKYPPNCQKGGFSESDQVIRQHLRDYERDRSGNLSSLPSVKLPDCALYGYGDEDHTTSPTDLTNESNRLATNLRTSMTNTFNNREPEIPDHELYGDEDNDVYENVSNGSKHLETNSRAFMPSKSSYREQLGGSAYLNSSCGKQVVSRGENGEKDGRHMYENVDHAVTSKNFTDVEYQNKTKYLGLLADRIKTGQERVGEHVGYEKSGRRFQGSQLRTAGEPPTQMDMFSPASCQHCRSHQDLVVCRNCGIITCQKCFEDRVHSCVLRVSNV